MRIAFDHQAFCLQTTGGISRYFCSLAPILASQEQAVAIFAPVYRNQYARDLNEGLIHGFGVKRYPPKAASAMVLANAWLSRQQIKRWQPDVVHETYFSNQPSAPVKTPRVVTVFDMIGELFGTDGADTNDRKRSKKYAAVSRADRVICISHQTRDDLVRLFDIPEDKISVIHLGCDQAPSRSLGAWPSTVQNNDRPFLLYVGLREGYKNFDRLLTGLAHLPTLRAGVDLIAFGGGAFTAQETQHIQRLNFRANQIRQMSGDDHTLDQLYRSAIAFVYPSIYEGFGLPPLEAMARNCPVISSQASVMPEVIGTAAEYFDPNEVDSISAAIEKVITDESRRRQLVGLGAERIQQFTWQRCAQETLAVYQRLHSGRAFE